MIDVSAVLKDFPNFSAFCSLEKLYRQVEALREDSRFQVTDVGHSVDGLPIHHVQFGGGSIRILLVGHQHCMEPIAALTIYGLLTLIQQDHPMLRNQDVEWHFVPCIDPDGALLNEGWSQAPLTFPSYMRNFHQQPWRDQVDASFPIASPTWTWDTPSQEARVLMSVLDRVQPDLFYSGHDARLTTGSFYIFRGDMKPTYCEQLSNLLRDHKLPPIECTALQRYPQTSEAVYRTKATLTPEDPKVPSAMKRVGGNSYHYLASARPEVLILTAELTYIRYLGDDLCVPSGESRRKILLHTRAENKLIAGAILDEWGAVRDHLNVTSPFYRKIHDEFIKYIDELPDGLQEWYEIPTTGQLISDPFYAQMASRGEWIDALIGTKGRFGFLSQAYEFVRLLKASKQTAAIREATARLDAVFDAALTDIDRHVDLRRFEPIDCTTLAKAHAGGGLIGLNSLLERTAARVTG